MPDVAEIKGMDALQGCSIGQLALAWVLGQGEDFIPIPGKVSLHA